MSRADAANQLLDTMPGNEPETLSNVTDDDFETADDITQDDISKGVEENTLNARCKATIEKQKWMWTGYKSYIILFKDKYNVEDEFDRNERTPEAICSYIQKLCDTEVR